MDELVSVIITTYKRESLYVEEAIKSVVNQTYRPIEVIVVDDNGDNERFSHDVYELCRQYQITYIKNDKNSGAQFSRNIGILNAKGKYLAFLDDDDIWREDKLQKQMDLFTHDTIGMVYCDGISFEDGNPENQWAFREASIYIQPINHKLELFNDYIGSTSQALIKKECFAKVGIFDNDMPARQDYEMWLRISREYEIVGSPEKLLYYRSHKGERISTNWNKCFRSYELVLAKHMDEYNRVPYAKAKIILRLFDSSMKMKKPIMACKYLIKAFVVNPQCVMDVIHRRLSKKSFPEYYTEEYLKALGLLESERG